MRKSLKNQRIKAVEDEFGAPIAEVLADYAKDHSWAFTLASLNLHPHYVAEYQRLFKRRHRGYVTNPKLTERNINNAPKHWGYRVAELAEMAGKSKSTIRQRIAAGWPFEKVISNKKYNGDTVNFGSNRNVETWVSAITNECASAKARKELKDGSR